MTSRAITEVVLFRETVEVWVGGVITPCTILCRRLEGGSLDCTLIDMWRVADDDDFADSSSLVALGTSEGDDPSFIRLAIEEFERFVAKVAHPAPSETQKTPS